jgi:hypothetical protein
VVRVVEYGIAEYTCNNLFIPIGQWVDKQQPEIWWPNLERIMLAFSDVHCAELLD